MSIQNDDIYIDLVLSNSIQSASNQRCPISFNQSQTQSILKDTTNYKLSITRFALNTELLPVFIPSMKVRTTTIYSFTMEYQGTYYQQFMQFIPQNINPEDPDEYYYVYNLQYVIYLMNLALKDSMTNLNNLITLPNLTYPTLTLSSDEKVTMTLNTAVYGYNELNKINIYMNFPMYSLLA